MKYDYYSQKLEVFWIRRKWRIAAAILAILSASFFLKDKPNHQEARIKTALENYHKGKGRVSIEILNYRKSPEYTLDSIHVADLLLVASAQIKRRYSQDNTFQQDTLYADSLEATTRMIDSLRGEMKSWPKKAPILITCRYVAAFSGDEKHSDTLTAILNESARVVWPR